MRRAAVLAWLVPNAPYGSVFIRFATKGEVILHFAIQSGLPAQSIKVRIATTVELLLTLLQAGDDKIIGDAGRGTIDVSAGANQEIFKAITAPECASFSVPPSPLAPLRSGHFLGSIFVSVYSRIFLNSKATARENDALTSMKDYPKSLSLTILMTSFVSLTQRQSCAFEVSKPKYINSD